MTATRPPDFSSTRALNSSGAMANAWPGFWICPNSRVISAFPEADTSATLSVPSFFEGASLTAFPELLLLPQPASKHTNINDDITRINLFFIVAPFLIHLILKYTLSFLHTPIFLTQLIRHQNSVIYYFLCYENWFLMNQRSICCLFCNRCDIFLYWFHIQLF